MTPALFTEVADFLSGAVIAQDPILEAALTASEEAGLPPVQVEATQGKLLQLFILSIGAKRILEVGTLGGYSSIWMARGLPLGGKMVTLELDPAHAAVATSNFDRAGLGHIIELRLGAATDSLAALHSEGAEPYDFVFIDADKASIPQYYDWVLNLTHPGSLIVVDNVVRGGGVIQTASEDPDIRGVRAFLASLKTDKRVTATAIQTVGSIGYDGFALLRVN